MKLLAPGFPASHQKGCVLLLMDCFVWLFCSSDADLVVQEKFVLFRRSKNGHWMFTDRCMEVKLNLNYDI
jgi:hypothetical protein